MRAFEQWRSDTKQDTSLPLVGMTDFSMTKVVSAYPLSNANKAEESTR
jgi:hypothetical protein